MKLLRVTCCLLVLLLSLVAFTFVAVHPAAAQTLNPPPPSFETCKTVGNGTICQGEETVFVDPSDTGIVCGSGSSSFDVFDGPDVYDLHAIRYYDQNGNLTKRVIHVNYSVGQDSNPLNGAVVPYTEHNTFTDVLAVPGDLTTLTDTTTGEVVLKPAHGAPVYADVGRVVIAFDGTLEFQAGRDSSIDYFYEGDTSVVQQLCAALA